MFLYLKDPKNTTKMHSEIINSFDKVAGYKISIENYDIFDTL
jgi:hypothetical protein